MKQKLSALLLALVITGCGSDSNENSVVSTPIVDTPDTPTDTSVPSQFNQVVTTLEQELAENNAAAATIAIYYKGELVLNQAYGTKALNSNNAVDTETLFQIGSTTKMMTATAILRAVEQGKLNLSDKLVDVVTGISYDSELWQDITIADLLTHQTGFEDDYDDAFINAELSDFLRLNYPQNNGLLNPPGEFFNYSNPNYSYLGAVLEQVYNQEFAEVIQQQVFQPLGMTSATVKAQDVENYANYSLGVLSSNQGFSRLSQVPHAKVTAPAGQNTWMTSADLMKMAQFLLTGNTDVLPLAMSKQLTTKHVHTEIADMPYYYGFGVFVDDGLELADAWYPIQIWHHGGNSDGYTSTFWLVPEQEFAVAVLSSGMNDDFTDTMLAAVEATIEMPDPVASPRAPINPELFSHFEGHYYAGDVEVLVKQEQQSLTMKIPAFEQNNISYSRTLTPFGGNSFVIEINGEAMLLSFVNGSNSDQPIYMRTRDFVAIRQGY